MWVHADKQNTNALTNSYDDQHNIKQIKNCWDDQWEFWNMMDVNDIEKLLKSKQ